MKVLILAAGYATRLGAVAKGLPKPLLPVADKPIIEYALEQLDLLDRIDEIVIVTNDKYYPIFQEWCQGHRFKKAIRIINDGTSTNEDRRGAVGDILWAMDQVDFDEETLIMAGDNIFLFPLAELVDYYFLKRGNCLVVHECHDQQRLTRTGIALLNDQNQVIDFTEKPEQPKSNLAVPPIYIYTREAMNLLPTYFAESSNSDAPGYFLEWLHTRCPVYAYRCIDSILDIGTPESYQAADKYLRNSIGI